MPPVKLSFALHVDDDWPPVGAEHVWCESMGAAFRLENAPFFINGLAFGDVFAATPDPINGHIFEFEVLHESGHSLVWMLCPNEADPTPFKDAFLKLGCSVEGFSQFSLHAIDVPPEISVERFDEILASAEENNFEFAFPVWRHGEST